MKRTTLAVTLTLELSTASCVGGSTVNVKYAQGYRPGPATVSVLGVFRNGRLSPESWATMASPVSTALGAVADRCEPAFGERLQREDEDLFIALDHDTRDGGITDVLLAKLASRAQGDVILTLTVHGNVGEKWTERRSDPHSVPTPSPPVRGAVAGGGPIREVVPRGAGIRPLELTASLYSVKEQRSLARVNVSYTGQRADEAIARFSREIGALVPGSTCKGWTFPSAAPLSGGP